MEAFNKVKDKLQKERKVNLGATSAADAADDCESPACKPRTILGSDLRRRFQSHVTRSSADGSSKSDGSADPSKNSKKEQSEGPSQQEDEEYWEKDEPPPDVIELGQAGWTILHSMAAYYPEHPTPEQRRKMKEFLESFAELYPCKVCAKDFESLLHKEPPKLDSRKDLAFWMCEAHNKVNAQLGKPLYPCQRVFQRWGAPNNNTNHAGSEKRGPQQHNNNNNQQEEALDQKERSSLH